MDKRISVFDRYAVEYDRWFDSHPEVFKSELNALRRFISEQDFFSLEVGVGTGRFAQHLGIKIGVEPAIKMAEIAKRRGIEVVAAVAENLPFSDSCFELVLMNTVLCFLDDPEIAIKEAKRVLKPKGKLLIGIIDKNSFLGRLYDLKRGRFYEYAKFYSVSDVIFLLKRAKFSNIKICQTIFRKPSEIDKIEPVIEGWGKGGFVAICAQQTK